MVPYDTLYKGTSKSHKTDKNNPFCGARLSINIRLKKLHYTDPPSKNIVGYIFLSYVDYCMINLHHSFVSFLFGSNPKTIFIS